MGICRFKTSELKPLIEHAKAATEFDMGYESERTPVPALLFIHDQGVYLMSNGIPRLSNGNNPNQPDVNSRVAYAEGCDPNVGAFDDWYGMSRELVGGDDFVEVLPIHDYWLGDCDLFETFEIDANSSSISYGFKDPKPTTPLPITEQPVTALNLGARARKCLAKFKFQNIHALTRYDAEDLLECRGLGVTSLNEIRRALAEHNLTLRGETIANQRDVVSR